MLIEKLFETKTSKAFQHLEMGMLPVKYVIMGKRLKFLKYILDESTGTIIRQVYEAQKSDSQKGDFVQQSKEDLRELKLELSENEIMALKKIKWNKIVNDQLKKIAFEKLGQENDTKKKTKHIKYKCFKMQNYLTENRKTKLSKTIFKIRSGTFGIKAWKIWKHDDNLCIMCEIKEESFEHFINCESYGEKTKDWESIFGSDVDKQVKIAIEAERRFEIRETKIQEVGQGSLPAPDTPNNLFVEF